MPEWINHQLSLEVMNRLGSCSWPTSNIPKKLVDTNDEQISSIFYKEYKMATPVYMLWYKHDGSCRAQEKVQGTQIGTADFTSALQLPECLYHSIINTSHCFISLL
jgi:hypothetical protein